jgi:hypothetical protein
MAWVFPDFFDHPDKIRFIEQEENENIELFLRQHGITNVPWIFFSLLAIIAPVLVVQLDANFSLHLFDKVPNLILVDSLVLWYMLILAYAFEKFLYWYYNIYIVTNFHLVDVDFISLLKRVITEIEIKDIESVRTDVSGIIRPLFNFGNVEIETAAKDQSSVFEAVPKPDIVADRIEDFRQKLSGGEGE